MKKPAVRKAVFAFVITCGPRAAMLAGKGFVILRHHLETITIIHEVINIPLEWERSK